MGRNTPVPVPAVRDQSMRHRARRRDFGLAERAQNSAVVPASGVIERSASAVIGTGTHRQMRVAGSIAPPTPTVTAPGIDESTALRRNTRRITAIDMLRGLVIVLMVLDHVRDYFHADAFAFNPLDPSRTTAILYATRWITHLCAPTFVFLAGVSAYQQGSRGRLPAHLSAFLLKRGIWLIALELTVVAFGWSFSFPYLVFMQVIWAIGCSMIALAALVWLPPVSVLAIGVAIVAGHNLLDPIVPEDFGRAAFLWRLLHEGGPITGVANPIGIVLYPILPWAGVMALGYGCGPLLTLEPIRRDRLVPAAGLAMLSTFAVLRGARLYGDPTAWHMHQTWVATTMSFFDVTKYPPSLHYVLVTLGLAFTIWPLLTRLRGRGADVLVTLGAVPLFVYVVHIYLTHAFAVAANATAGRDVAGLFDTFRKAMLSPDRLQGLGFELPVVFAAWLVVLVLLYPLARWFASVKARRRDWWLSYL